MDVLIRALGVAGAATAVAKLHPRNTRSIDAVMTAALPESNAAGACIDRLSIELGVPRWFVNRNIGVMTSFDDGRVYVTVDLNEKSGTRRFSDPEVAMRLAARYIELGNYDDSDMRGVDGRLNKDRFNRLMQENAEWKSAVLAAAPTFCTTDRRDLTS
jgi:hypothetical protein